MGPSSNVGVHLAMGVSTGHAAAKLARRLVHGAGLRRLVSFAHSTRGAHDVRGVCESIPRLRATDWPAVPADRCSGGFWLTFEPWSASTSLAMYHRPDAQRRELSRSNTPRDMTTVDVI